MFMKDVEGKIDLPTNYPSVILGDAGEFKRIKSPQG